MEKLNRIFRREQNMKTVKTNANASRKTREKIVNGQVAPKLVAWNKISKNMPKCYRTSSGIENN